MHNLHIAVTCAQYAEEAIHQVETEIESWGNGDNWRCVYNAYREDGQVYSSEDQGSWKYQSLEECIKDIKKEFVEIYTQALGQRHKTLAELVDDPTTKFELPSIVKNLIDYDFLDENVKKDFNRFDPFEHEFNNWKLDRFGVTHVYMPPTEHEWKYLVLIDMHS